MSSEYKFDTSLARHDDYNDRQTFKAGDIMNYSVDIALVLDFQRPPTDQEVIDAVIRALKERMEHGILDGCLTITGDYA